MKILSIIGLAIVAVVGAIYWVGAQAPVYANSDKDHIWFAAIKGQGAAPSAGVEILWSSTADQMLVGQGDAYWQRFMILGSDAVPDAAPMSGAGLDDLYLAKVQVTAPPKLVLGVLRLSYLIGLSDVPEGNPESLLAGDLSASPFLPSRENITGLMARPQTYQPHMVNFLAYKPDGGRDSYMKYGAVAIRTVYSTGGQLHFASRVEEVLVEAKAGPTARAWDDIAIMAYDKPTAIFSMDEVPAYHDALGHRDDGLAATIVIATHR